jgi:2-oxoisovalerate dehydrogenase E1 component alpha subunit
VEGDEIMATTGKSRVQAKKKGPAKSKAKSKSTKKVKTSRKDPKTKSKRVSAKKVKKSSSSSRQKVIAKKIPLDKSLLIKMYDLMVLSRVLEERMIQVYRKGGAYFWIGAPGEEAFGVPLGMLGNIGQGPEFDYWHLHYRGTPTLLAMGMDPKDALRLIMNKSTDTSTGGRNFSNHYCYPKWNVVPVSSPIEVQYTMAIGTGIAQRRRRPKAQGVTFVTGGDAGSAEGDFASCLIWASRPGFELPMYITVQNNRWGISTNYGSQHGEEHVSDRGKAFGIQTRVYNGNDPVEAYLGIKNDLEWIRKTGKPVLAEFEVSRLYGHSSASGANRVSEEPCCIELFKKRLIDQGTLTSQSAQKIWDEHFETIKKAADSVSGEGHPDKSSIWDHTYANNENADWRLF